MTRSDVQRKLMGRMIINDNIEVFLDCQENNGVKSITYKDANKHSHFGVTGITWNEVYAQMTNILRKSILKK